MPWTENTETNLARRIIELSDQISEHSKKLTEKGFVPTKEFIEETRRLAELCHMLKAEAEMAHSEHEN